MGVPPAMAAMTLAVWFWPRVLTNSAVSPGTRSASARAARAATAAWSGGAGAANDTRTPAVSPAGGAWPPAAPGPPGAHAPATTAAPTPAAAAPSTARRLRGCRRMTALRRPIVPARPPPGAAGDSVGAGRGGVNRPPPVGASSSSALILCAHPGAGRAIALSARQLGQRGPVARDGERA